MSESLKRTVRTAYVVLATLAVALPVLVTQVPHSVPGYQLLAGFAVAVVTANRGITWLEDRGVLPAFLRNIEPRLDVVDAIASAAADAAAAAPALARLVPAAAGVIDAAAGPVADTVGALEQSGTPEPLDPAVTVGTDPTS